MDTIANMLTSIRNGCMASKTDVIVPHSKMKERILEIMRREGFVSGFENVKVGVHPGIKVRLSYDSTKRPVINKIVKVSTPGRRVYIGYEEVSPVIRGLGISIISTSKGLMTDKEAIANKLGGELICKIW